MPAPDLAVGTNHTCGGRQQTGKNHSSELSPSSSETTSPSPTLFDLPLHKDIHMSLSSMHGSEMGAGEGAKADGAYSESTPNTMRFMTGTRNSIARTKQKKDMKHKPEEVRSLAMGSIVSIGIGEGLDIGNSSSSSSASSGSMPGKSTKDNRGAREGLSSTSNRRRSGGMKGGALLDKTPTKAQSSYFGGSGPSVKVNSTSKGKRRNGSSRSGTKRRPLSHTTSTDAFSSRETGGEISRSSSNLSLTSASSSSFTTSTTTMSKPRIHRGTISSIRMVERESSPAESCGSPRSPSWRVRATAQLSSTAPLSNYKRPPSAQGDMVAWDSPHPSDGSDFDLSRPSSASLPSRAKPRNRNSGLRPLDFDVSSSPFSPSSIGPSDPQRKNVLVDQFSSSSTTSKPRISRPMSGRRVAGNPTQSAFGPLPLHVRDEEGPLSPSETMVCEQRETEDPSLSSQYDELAMLLRGSDAREKEWETETVDTPTSENETKRDRTLVVAKPIVPQPSKSKKSVLKGKATKRGKEREELAVPRPPPSSSSSSSPSPSSPSATDTTPLQPHPFNQLRAVDGDGKADDNNEEGTPLADEEIEQLVARSRQAWNELNSKLEEEDEKYVLYRVVSSL